MKLSLRERLPLIADGELGSSGVLAFIGQYSTLINLREELKNEKLVKRPTEIVGPYATSPHADPLYRLKIDPSDYDTFADYGISAAMVAKINRGKSVIVSLAPAPTPVVYNAQSPAEIEISAKQRKAINELNALTWVKADKGWMTRVELLSKTSLVELIALFHISGLYEAGTDNRTMTRTLTLYDKAVEELEKHGFTGHKRGHTASSAVAGANKNDDNIKLAVGKLNQTNTEGELLWKWSLSPGIKGMQLDFIFDNRNTAQLFVEDYLLDAGVVAENISIRDLVSKKTDPVTGVEHSTTKHQIVVNATEVARLKHNGMQEATRLFPLLFPKSEEFSRGGFKGRS